MVISKAFFYLYAGMKFTREDHQSGTLHFQNDDFKAEVRDPWRRSRILELQGASSEMVPTPFHLRAIMPPMPPSDFQGRAVAETLASIPRF